MSKKTTRLLTLLSLGLNATFTLPLFGSGGSEADRAPEKEVIACLRAIEVAAEKLDVDAVFARVMDNNRGALVQNGRILLTREKALETTREGFVGVRKVKYAIGQEHVTMLTKDLALVVSDGQSHFELDDGRLFDTPFAQSVVLKRVAGAWKVLHAHRSFPVKL
jgi:hypothetical protein